MFLDAFKLGAVPAAASTLRAVELLHDAYRSDGRTWSESPPVSFLRAPLRDAVLSATDTGNSTRRIWEAAILLALRARLRAGDIWVEDNRQWRAVEDQFIPPALFTAMRVAGPLPVAVPAAADYMAECSALLDRRLADVTTKAAADILEDVRVKGDEMKISPLKAVTPQAAEELAEQLYAMIPETVQAYKDLTRVERAFRCFKTVDLDIRPIHHRTAARVRAHVFLCMLAYHVEWHLRDASAKLLFHDTELAAPRADCSSPVDSTEPFDAVKAKKATKRSVDGNRVMGFTGLMAHLGILTQDIVRAALQGKHRFTLCAKPTQLQEAAFKLLGLDPVRVH